MEFFAPENLPGVGMGTLASVAAVIGLIGLAVTSGALVAQGLLGTLAYLACALLVLQAKPYMGEAPAATSAVMTLLVLLAGTRLLVERRAASTRADLVGAPADSAETKQARAGIQRAERRAAAMTMTGVAIAGAAAGFAWAEWNEVPFRLEDREAVIGMVIGTVAALIGGDAAWRFVSGATRAGGSPAIVGVVVVLVALALNVGSVYVPFFGLAALVLSIVLAVRLRRRVQQKHAGLRILR